MKICKLFVSISFFVFVLNLNALAQTISGVIIDERGEALPGASIVLKNSTIGTQTDINGKYTLNNVPSTSTIVVKFIGYISIEEAVNGRSIINFTLKEEATSLQEMVVVGYGTQKKADLTGSISTIKSEEIEKTPNANVVQSIQGKVSGVQIVSAGGPGDSPTVRVRGLGTFTGATSVLYVVDGMFYSTIDFLDAKDVKSISVLKDASSSAIYGVRGANGVIIIETKSGVPNKKPVIEYDGYGGVQHAQNVLKMANTEQFTNMALESGAAPDAQFILNAMQRFGRSRINPNVPVNNTDWYKEILRDAAIQSHSLGITGGAESVNYSLGASYFTQDGLLDMKNDYSRFNIRAKLDVKLNERMKVGVNTIFSNATRYSGEDAAWFNAYFATPTMPVYDELNTDAFPNQFSNAQLLGYRGVQNPRVPMSYNDNRLKVRKLLASIYFQTDFIKDKLTFKTTYNHDFSTLEGRNVNLPYTMGNNVQSKSGISRSQNNYSNQIWDNILTFNQAFGNHNLTVLAGTSFRDEAASSLRASGQDIKGIQLPTSWYLDFADPTSFSGNVGDNATRYYGVSYFGRAAYNYNDKYLLYGTLRADGSSKFTQDHWGVFPSVGLGWVISKEDFMANNSVFNFLKLRASWGQLGNDNVAASAGSNTINVVNVDLGDQPATGITSTSTFTNNTWELIEEKNFGISANFLKSRLSLEADYYIRDTKNAILPVFIPIVNLYVARNAGTIRNLGLELSLNWDESIGTDFSYNVGLNLTTLKNHATKLPDPGYIDSGTAEFRQRTRIGDPLFAFFGYERIGVYQNQAAIDADPIAVANKLVPGDLIYKDQNKDGAITDDDRVILGSFLPKLSYGGNIGANYKAFGFSAYFYGQSGNKILNRKRGEIIFTNDTNMDADLAINRWHGDGTSNSYPSSAGLRKGWNQKLSDFWIEDGKFFRVQNVQLNYTLSKLSIFGKDLPTTKFYITAEKPLTVFNYNGFNPEVSSGVDRQTYPVPAIYSAGINIKL